MCLECSTSPAMTLVYGTSSPGNKKIEYKEIMERFDPEGHPSVKASLLSADVIHTCELLLISSLPIVCALTYSFLRSGRKRSHGNCF